MQHLYSMRFGGTTDFITDNKLAITTGSNAETLPIIP